jgi:hypothetical protein
MDGGAQPQSASGTVLTAAFRGESLLQAATQNAGLLSSRGRLARAGRSAMQLGSQPLGDDGDRRQGFTPSAEELTAGRDQTGSVLSLFAPGGRLAALRGSTLHTLIQDVADRENAAAAMAFAHARLRDRRSKAMAVVGGEQGAFLAENKPWEPAEPKTARPTVGRTPSPRSSQRPPSRFSTARSVAKVHQRSPMDDLKRQVDASSSTMSMLPGVIRTIAGAKTLAVASATPAKRPQVTLELDTVVAATAAAHVTGHLSMEQERPPLVTGAGMATPLRLTASSAAKDSPLRARESARLSQRLSESVSQLGPASGGFDPFRTDRFGSFQTSGATLTRNVALNLAQAKDLRPEDDTEAQAALDVATFALSNPLARQAAGTLMEVPEGASLKEERRANAASAVLGALGGRVQTRYFLTDVNRETELPSWVVRRPELHRVLRRGAEGGDLPLFDALTIPPGRRSGPHLMTVIRWLRRRSPHFASLPDAALRPVAQALTAVHLAPGARLEAPAPIMSLRGAPGGKGADRLASWEDETRGDDDAQQKQAKAAARATRPEDATIANPCVWFIASGSLILADGTSIRRLKPGDVVGATAWLRTLERGLTQRFEPTGRGRRASDVVDQARLEAALQREQRVRSPRAKDTSTAQEVGFTDDTPRPPPPKPSRPAEAKRQPSRPGRKLVAQRAAAALLQTESGAGLLQRRTTNRGALSVNTSLPSSAESSAVSPASKSSPRSGGGQRQSPLHTARIAARRASLSRAVKRTTRRFSAVFDAGAAGAVAIAAPEGSEEEKPDGAKLASLIGNRIQGDDTGRVHGISCSLVCLTVEAYERAVQSEQAKLARAAALWFQLRSPPFRDWSIPRLLSMTRWVERRSLKEGEVVWKQGDPADSVCWIVEGECEAVMTVHVKAEHKLPGAPERGTDTLSIHRPVDAVVRHVGPGAIIGEEAIWMLIRERRMAVLRKQGKRVTLGGEVKDASGRSGLQHAAGLIASTLAAGGWRRRNSLAAEERMEIEAAAQREEEERKKQEEEEARRQEEERVRRLEEAKRVSAGVRGALARTNWLELGQVTVRAVRKQPSERMGEGETSSKEEPRWGELTDAGKPSKSTAHLPSPDGKQSDAPKHEARRLIPQERTGSADDGLLSLPPLPKRPVTFIAVRNSELVVLRAPYLRFLMRKTAADVAAAVHSSLHRSTQRVSLREQLGRSEANDSAGEFDSLSDSLLPEPSPDTDEALPLELRGGGEAVRAIWTLVASQPSSTDVAHFQAQTLQLRNASKAVHEHAIGPRASRRLASVTSAAPGPGRRRTDLLGGQGPSTSSADTPTTGMVLPVSSTVRGINLPMSSRLSTLAHLTAASSSGEMSPRLRSLWDAISSGESGRLRQSKLVQRHIAAADAEYAKRAETLEEWSKGMPGSLSAASVPLRMLDDPTTSGVRLNEKHEAIFPLATTRIPFLSPRPGESEEDAIAAASAVTATVEAAEGDEGPLIRALREAGVRSVDAATMTPLSARDVVEWHRQRSTVDPSSLEAAAGPGGAYSSTGLSTLRTGVRDLAVLVEGGPAARLSAAEMRALHRAQQRSLARYIAPCDPTLRATGQAALAQQGAPDTRWKTDAASLADSKVHRVAGAAILAQKREVAFSRLFDSQAAAASVTVSDRSEEAGPSELTAEPRVEAGPVDPQYASFRQLMRSLQEEEEEEQESKPVHEEDGDEEEDDWLVNELPVAQAATGAQRSVPLLWSASSANMELFPAHDEHSLLAVAGRGSSRGGTATRSIASEASFL